MSPRDPDFEALKDVTRMAWLLDFEAIASAVNDDDPVPPGVPAN